MRNTIAAGLHTVPRSEINFAAIPKDRRNQRQHWYGYWPEEKSNAQLRRCLCTGCDPQACEIKCKFGREAQRRVDAGEMAPCMGLKQRKVTA